MIGWRAHVRLWLDEFNELDRSVLDTFVDIVRAYLPILIPQLLLSTALLWRFTQNRRIDWPVTAVWRVDVAIHQVRIHMLRLHLLLVIHVVHMIHVIAVLVMRRDVIIELHHRWISGRCRLLLLLHLRRHRRRRRRIVPGHASR